MVKKVSHRDGISPEEKATVLDGPTNLRDYENNRL
jgi:hypothetical protein